MDFTPDYSSITVSEKIIRQIMREEGLIVKGKRRSFDGMIPSWTISTTLDSVLVNTMHKQAIL